MSTDLVMLMNRVALSGDDEADDIGDGFVDTTHAGPPGPICPVCHKLPLEELALSSSEMSLTYESNFESLPREDLEAWAGYCHLAKLVRDLEMYWGGQREKIDLFGDAVFREICERGFRRGQDLKERWQICGTVESPFFRKTAGSAVYPDPLSAPSMARIQHWIETCKSKHTSCNILDTTLPTRVLDLAKFPTVILCEVTNEQGLYIALSHCWGLSKTFTTTLETMDTLKSGFNAHDLPATFRDAIAVTRALGIQYLWIDSLCIIQGHAEDWKREARKMASVYANSYLTIAASNAAGDDGGFLKQREVFHHPLKIITSTGRSSQYYLRKLELEVPVFSISPAAVYTEPLDTRAWTLQEALLPKRVLRFNTKESGWECTKAGLRERWPDVNNAGRTHKLENLWPKAKVSNNSTSWPFGEWYKLIEGFVNRNLTYDTDKLPSIAGIVSMLVGMEKEMGKSRSGYKYCAGIWWHDLPTGLLWAAEGTDEGETSKLRKPSKYLAPSWSWASLNGAIYHPLAVIENTVGYGHLRSVIFKDVHLEGATVEDGGYMGCQPFPKVTQETVALGYNLGTDTVVADMVFMDLAEAELAKAGPVLNKSGGDEEDRHFGRDRYPGGPVGLANCGPQDYDEVLAQGRVYQCPRLVSCWLCGSSVPYGLSRHNGERSGGRISVERYSIFNDDQERIKLRLNDMDLNPND
ncbi:HET-domain-containing protein [Acephala macrosclerotiorum]|nr:HET-domain-containing protein [Acephala macrosclerotiorum]